MMRVIFFLIAFLFFSSSLRGQNEGVIAVKPRIAKPSAAFLGIGLASPLNTEAYFGGPSIEAGFHRRLNLILTVGALVSFSQVQMNAGRLKLATVALDARVNLIAVKDHTRLYPFMILRPTFGSAAHKDVDIKNQSFSGFAFGPGVEFSPPGSAVSVFAELAYLTTSKIYLQTDDGSATSVRSFQCMTISAGVSYKF